MIKLYVSSAEAGGGEVLAPSEEEAGFIPSWTLSIRV